MLQDHHKVPKQNFYLTGGIQIKRPGVWLVGWLVGKESSFRKVSTWMIDTSVIANDLNNDQHQWNDQKLFPGNTNDQESEHTHYDFQHQCCLRSFYSNEKPPSIGGDLVGLL